MDSAPRATLDDILKRIEELEKQVKNLRAGLEELRDIQFMEKMDIVNLKNEIEAMEMENPEFTSKREEARNLEELAAELRDMRERLAGGRLTVCKNCGSMVAGGDKYCGKCGGRI